MRQSLAKHQRRDLRRAMGIGALSAMQEQEQAIGILSNAVASCQREIASLAIDHAKFKRSTASDILLFIKDANERVDTFKSRSFLQRLRWVFTGR